MKYTTLEDLKKWPKLFAAAEWNIENISAPAQATPRTDLDSFAWAASEQGREFWDLVFFGNFDRARALRPALFEEEQAFVVGSRYRLVAGSQEYPTNRNNEHVGEVFHCKKPGTLGSALFLADVCKCTTDSPFAMSSSWEPIPDEQEEKPTIEQVRDTVDDANKRAAQANMIKRDGTEAVSKPPEKPNPMAKHTESLSRALSVDTFAITKFDPRGMC